MEVEMLVWSDLTLAAGYARRSGCLVGIDVRVLGRFAVSRDGEELAAGAFVGRLAPRLLRLLAVHRGELLPKDLLADAIWPERMPADPNANLEVLVARIRRAIGVPEAVRTGPGGYAFPEDEGFRVDADDVLRAAERGGERLAAGSAAAALAEFLRAIDRWRGEPLPEDAYEEWAQAPRQRLAGAYLDVLDGAAAASLALGDSARARALAERAVERQPLRESSNLMLVRALANAGDRAASLEAFTAFRERFADELGLDPSHEALELQARLLRGEPLPQPRATRPATVTPVRARPAFVGRHDELEAVLGDERVVLIEGVSGAGKTRLLNEAAARSTVPVILAGAFAAERSIAWGLARSLLREALALDALAARTIPQAAADAMVEILPELPELRAAAPRSLEGRSRRALAIEGARRLVEAVATVPTLVLIDDLQWADASSLQLIGLVTARLPGLRLAVACRPEELGPEARAFIGELGDVRRIRLGPLDRSAIQTLAVDPAVATAIVERTDRTPLTVLEVLRTLEGGERDARAAARAGQRRAIDARVARLPADERRALATLAIAGREIPAAVVGAVDGVDHATALERLDALAAAELARAGERGWTVAHDAIGEALVAALPSTDRARAHLALASAIEVEGAEPAEVAAHLAAAGDVAGALDRYREAAASALRWFANAEAEAFATKALGLDPGPSQEAELRTLRAEGRRRAGDLEGAREDLRAAVALADEHGASGALAALAMVESGSQDYARASDLVELALTRAGDDQRRRAEALAVGAIVDLNLGNIERSNERSALALDLFRGIGDASGAAGILDGRAMATFLGGRIREAVEAFDRVARLFGDTGELLRVSTPRSTRGHGLVFMDRAAEGLADTEEALELSRSLGHAEGQAYALWHRAEALAALGRPEEAIASAEEALAIAERLGHREWTIAAYRAVGIARAAAGDHEAAAAAHRRSAGLAVGIPLFETWANARLALALLAMGACEEAEAPVARALALGSPLAAYEATWAEAELLAARGDPRAAAVARAGAARAGDGGYLAAVPRLREIAQAFA